MDVWRFALRPAIVTGADHNYFPLMQALLRSLIRKHGPAYPLLVLDFGMKPEQLAAIEPLAAKIVRPGWWFEAPSPLRLSRNLGYAARPMIPDYLPGYDVYLWLDADISVQDGRFASAFLQSAEQGALAIVEEVDPAYRTELYALKWWIGNAVRCFGISDGLRLSLRRPINSGAFALRADAPHWAAWRRHYESAVLHSGRANLDQHALMATLVLDGLPASLLGSCHNWICVRSQPIWDEDRQVFCRPCPPHEPISVLHFAGRQKDGLRDVKTLQGHVRTMPLSYARPEDDIVNAEAA